jgi:hypothetical protein
VGLAAAALLAVSPLAVRDSHYVKHDVPATLAILIAYIVIARIWPVVPAPGRDRNAVLLAGAACGVAFSTHYYAIFLVLPFVWAVVQRWRQSGWRVVGRQLLAGGLMATVVFFALSPFILVDPLVAWRDITANRQIVIDRAVQAGAFAPAARYLEIVWTDSMSQPVVALGCLGAAWMLVATPARAILLLAFPIVFLAFIANTAPASRYLNPVLPFLALFAAWAISRFAGRLRLPSAGQYAVVVALMIFPLITSVEAGLFFRTDDTRTLARRFVEQRIPAGSSILVQPYSVVLTPSRQGLLEALTRNLGTPDAASTKFRLQLSVDPYPAPAYRLIWLGRGGLDAEKIYVDPAELAAGDAATVLRRMGVTYVILKRYNRLEPELIAFAEELARRGRLLAEFSPYRAGISDADRVGIEPFLHNTDTRIDDALVRPGPPLEIWQIDGPDS